MQKEPLTAKDYDTLTALLNDLKVNQRPQILEAIESARQLGDLKENAEYHAAKEEQASMNKKISELEDFISRSIIIDPSTLDHKKISFGSTIILLDLEDDKNIKYKIVSSMNSNPDLGYISFHSPLAKQLLGKEEGDEVHAKLPGGEKDFEILEVYYEE